MAAPDALIGVNQLLTSLSRVTVRRDTYNVKKRYVVESPEGAVLFKAKEYRREFEWGSNRKRAFNIDVLDSQHATVMSLRRPFTFGPDKMDVQLCGRLVSVVREQKAFFKKVLSINDADDQPVLRVKGPALSSQKCDFDVFNPNREKIGVIQRCWNGTCLELILARNSFDIQFPQDLDVDIKAAVIATCVLIDFKYY